MISGRKNGGRCGVYLCYSEVAALEVLQERSGRSRSSIIRECVRRALREIAKESRIRLPSANRLPQDRRAYLVEKGLGV